jgi:hypothetical protein
MAEPASKSPAVPHQPTGSAREGGRRGPHRPYELLRDVDWLKPYDPKRWRPGHSRPIDFESLKTEFDRFEAWIRGDIGDGPPFSVEFYLAMLGLLSTAGDDRPDPTWGRAMRGLWSKRGFPHSPARARSERLGRALIANRKRLDQAVSEGAPHEYYRLLVGVLATGLTDPPADERYGKGNRPEYLLPTDRRICLEPGCGLPIPNRLKSGFCPPHYEVRRKRQKALSSKKWRDRVGVLTASTGPAEPALEEVQKMLGEAALAERDRRRAGR